MNIKTVGSLLAGSILVHAAVAACSSDDAVSDRPAHAEETAPVVTPATCNATFQVALGGDAGTTTVPYSEQAYPGKSKGEIAAHVTNWSAIDDALSPPDYMGGLRLQTNLAIRDGFAAAPCAAGKTSYFVWK